MKLRYCSFVFIITVLLIMNGCAAKPAIIKAAGLGDISTIKKLQAEGRNVNESDSNGATALMSAINNNKIDVAKYLIESGADINAKDKTGYDALFCSIENGQLEIMKILIDKGANKESKSWGMTPLLFATFYSAHIDIIKLLIESGADINAQNDEGATVLDLALSSTRRDIVDVLMKVGVNPWTPSDGKARLCFVGTGLYDYPITITVGNQSKKLNQMMYVGLAFIDVDTGKHTIDVKTYEGDVKGKKAFSIDVTAGQTYYLKVTQDMKRRAAQYAAVKLSSVVISPLREDKAKEEIREIFSFKRS